MKLSFKNWCEQDTWSTFWFMVGLFMNFVLSLSPILDDFMLVVNFFAIIIIILIRLAIPSERRNE